MVRGYSQVGTFDFPDLIQTVAAHQLIERGIESGTHDCPFIDPHEQGTAHLCRWEPY